MMRSAAQPEGRRGRRAWLRRGHRWLGLATIFFVLALSVTGIALNHSSDWKLDRRYVRWDWAVAALGIRVPELTASYVDRGHQVTQLGERAYVDTRELPYEVDSLVGIVVLEPLVVVATTDTIYLLTVDGEFVQRIDLSAELPVLVERIGRVDRRPVLQSGPDHFIGDADVTAFVPWIEADTAIVDWSIRSDPAPDEIEALEDLYRGRSLTVERLLIEIHSGRIVGAAGPLLLDVVAIGFILLGISGVVVWWRGNGKGGYRRRTNGNPE